MTVHMAPLERAAALPAVPVVAVVSPITPMGMGAGVGPSASMIGAPVVVVAAGGAVGVGVATGGLVVDTAEALQPQSAENSSSGIRTTSVEVIAPAE